MTSNLLESILEGGIRSPNFFNGRLLSGEDLNLERIANRDARRRLGRTVGDGVAFGFEVTESTHASTFARPVLTIMPGLAVNRSGQTLMLTAKTDLSLVRTLEPPEQAAHTFEDCMPPSPDLAAAGGGVYLLVICPGCGKEGRAPVSGLGDTPASCNSRYLVEGLQFRLIKLDVSDEMLADTARLRNRVAYQCFGLTDAGYTDHVADPFAPVEAGYGLLDDLRPRVLTNCDVPLAVLYWTSTGGIRFIDMWAVRRRIARSSTEDGWLALIGSRRVREGEAMFLQFQNELDDMVRSEPDAASVEAVSRFDLLPPIGFLPLDAGARAKGLNPVNFFKTLTVNALFSTSGERVPAAGHAIRDAIYIESAAVSDLLRDALLYPPIDLKTKELIWLYVVRENMEPLEAGKAPSPRPFALFVSGHLAYRGRARYDVNRWDYGNYA